MAHAVPTLVLVAATRHAHGAAQRPAVPVLSAPLSFRPRRRLRAVSTCSAAASTPPQRAAGQPPFLDAVRSHVTLALDGTARLALPQGQLPAEGKLPISHAFWAFCGCFASMALFGAVDQYVLAPRGVPFLMGSFGTISVLYFCVGLRAPFLRPWNVIAGHVVAAALACVCVQCVQPLFLARALALACTVATMLWTGCVHPPGGALVLILCDSAKFQALGWTYLLYPGVSGSMLLMLFAYCTDEAKQRFVFTADDVRRKLAGRKAVAPV